MACGAGFLACAFAEQAQWVYGIDLSRRMLHEAHTRAQMLGRHHQYPDGAVLFLGTMFAPIKDRGAKGQGFTHKTGDVTSVSAPELGTLANRMTLSTEAPPWDFGCGALMHNLARRGLL